NAGRSQPRHGPPSSIRHGGRRGNRGRTIPRRKRITLAGEAVPAGGSAANGARELEPVPAPNAGAHVAPGSARGWPGICPGSYERPRSRPIVDADRQRDAAIACRLRPVILSVARATTGRRGAATLYGSTTAGACGAAF